VFQVALLGGQRGDLATQGQEILEDFAVLEFEGFVCCEDTGVVFFKLEEILRCMIVAETKIGEFCTKSSSMILRK
jgi:hypothetical protein